MKERLIRYSGMTRCSALAISGRQKLSSVIVSSTGRSKPVAALTEDTARGFFTILALNFSVLSRSGLFCGNLKYVVLKSPERDDYESY